MASIKLSLKFEYRFCWTNYSQDGQQNGRHLSVYFFLTLYLSHLLPDFFQVSYMDYLYKTLAQVIIWALSDNQDGHHNLVYSVILISQVMGRFSYCRSTARYSICYAIIWFTLAVILISQVMG